MKRTLYLSVATASLFVFAPGNASAATGNDKIALRYLETAVAQCEKGLLAPPPRSEISLKVLQRYQAKYQRYLRAALDLSPDLEDSTQNYYGAYFKEKPFNAVFDACEIELNDKVGKAVAFVEQKNKELLGNVQTPAQKWARAKEDAANAIDSYCSKYLLPPHIDRVGSDAEARLNLDKTTYDLNHRNALALFPDIVTTAHQGKMGDDSGRRTESASQSIGEWFDYCGNVFSQYEQALVQVRAEQRRRADEELMAPMEDDADADAAEPMAADDAGAGDAEPMAADDADAGDDEPMAEDDADAGDDEPMAEDDADAGDDEPMAEDDADAGDDEPMAEDDADLVEDEDFVALKAQVKGGRLQVLEEEGRVPDFTSDDDNPHKAKTWNYESEEGDSCTVYTFSGDKLTATKPLRSACP